MKVNGIKLMVSILVCQGAGIIGGLFNRASIDTWYVGLKKPGFNPPNWVFAPVWISLYLLMGIALYLVWKADIPARESEKLWAMAFFWAQLVLNVLWSYFFFYLQSPLSGLIDITVLWVLILLTIVKFYPLSRTAALLLIPYILWVTFAALLNYALWHLNR
jgi:tryptophan-rich sensory protein